jgi:hypothetical protein
VRGFLSNQFYRKVIVVTGLAKYNGPVAMSPFKHLTVDEKPENLAGITVNWDRGHPVRCVERTNAEVSSRHQEQGKNPKSCSYQGRIAQTPQRTYAADTG